LIRFIKPYWGKAPQKKKKISGKGQELKSREKRSKKRPDKKQRWVRRVGRPGKRSGKEGTQTRGSPMAHREEWRTACSDAKRYKNRHVDRRRGTVGDEEPTGMRITQQEKVQNAQFARCLEKKGEEKKLSVRLASEAKHGEQH